MKPKYPGCTVKLLGEDSNAFFIMGKVRSALLHHLRRDLGFTPGAAALTCDRYLDEAKAGDYNNLLQTTMKWVVVS